MQTLPGQTYKKCQFCGKQVEIGRLKEFPFCPACKTYIDKPPKPEKGQFVDTDTVSKKQLVRIDDWAIKLMHKYQHLFSDDIPRGQVFIRESLKPEDVDIPQIYDFSELSYQIYRRLDGTFAIRIMQKGKMIVEAAYANL